MTDESTTKLTRQQRRFCQEYLVDFNAARAAKRAGYSDKVAVSLGPKLLEIPKIREYIDKLEEPIRRRLNITASRVLEELAGIAFADMGTYAKWGPRGVELKPSDELRPSDRAAVSELSQTITKDGGSIRFKLHDKPTALVNLGKHLQMFKETLVLEDARDAAMISALKKLSDKELDKLQADLEGRTIEVEAELLPAETEPDK